MQSFNQATAMTRFYAKPMLLIEFDSNKPFALQVEFYYLIVFHLSQVIGTSPTSLQVCKIRSFCM